MLVDMWMVRWLADLLGGSEGAIRNARIALEANRESLAAVDSVVARIQRHVEAANPAA